ncbi:MAG: protein translocase subunit SecF [Clostridia bacterium]|nr:protein translocase subunit SecF [Clostridia bacterium]
MAKMFDFNKNYKKFMIAYLAIFVVGIVIAAIWGVDLDINFRGGTRISYSYSGDLAEKDIRNAVDEAIKEKFEVSKSTSIAGDTNTFSISLIGNKSLSAKTQESITKALTEKFKDSKIELYDSNSVSPNIAGSFFFKSMVAVAIAAALVVVYVGIRFRKIGGVSAGLAALVALVLDVLITFFTCVFFRLQIDSNYIAVVLTILGYSLNDTIVAFDRIRENRKLYPEDDIAELVNKSINMVLIRNIVTSLTTFIAVLTVVGVSELFGLTSLRTFGIPMAFGVLSGSITSICIAGPIWVIWQKKKLAKKAK